MLVLLFSEYVKPH